MRDEATERDGSFADLGLREPLLRVISDVGYETPMPVQAQTIPALLAGRDVIGQAQTGTGKTGAFALPILQALRLDQPQVQGLVLVPTRELALQVSEAMHTYGRYLGTVHVLPVNGGQSIAGQSERLRRGTHLVVGTPGRVMDHLRRATLRFEALRMVVLDEADEMLHMGFLEDVEWILSQIPHAVQTMLFSATMPPEIRRTARRYLHDPVTVAITPTRVTVPTIEQRYLNVSEHHKLDTLTRILEIEPAEAVLIFARTKIGAADLAEKLQARGYAAEALHGDLSQAQREQVMRRLRSGQSELVVATDVAARGLDIERISLVINYDIPCDTEVYIHRIGRTGRAGRQGKAILFVTPRQARLQRHIERLTGQRLAPMSLPTQADVARRRIALFKDSLRQTLAAEDPELYLVLVEELAEEGYDMAEIAAAAARLARGDKPPEVTVEPESPLVPQPEEGMVRLFIAAGRQHGIRARDIVGAIANEADVPGKAIASIDIFDRFTFAEVPTQYKDQGLQRMAHTTLRNRPVHIRVATPDSDTPASGKRSTTRQPRQPASQPRRMSRRPATGKAVRPAGRSV
jgi:ATP-dependent RNA helicase DeaD